MKYARLERERRFLLAAPPRDLVVQRVLHIHDRYLVGTRLRLRLVEERGRPVVYKLGQKVPLDDAAPSIVAHTTMYLNEAEFAALRDLPSRELRKARHVAPAGECALLIDVFGGHLLGLTLAEIELGPEATEPSRLPVDVVTEVTDDRRFTGGALAATTADHLRALLAEFGLPGPRA